MCCTTACRCFTPMLSMPLFSPLGRVYFFLGQRFSVRNHWREVREIGATVDYLLGAMVAMLMNADPSPQDRQHSVHVALAPATPAHLIEPFAQRFGVELVDGFGSTETNLVIGTLPGDRRAGYMGRVMSGYDAAVVNDGTAAADGSPANWWSAARSPAPVHWAIWARRFRRRRVGYRPVTG
ncbi:AMP-binding protein [Rhodococcus sp. 3Y1]